LAGCTIAVRHLAKPLIIVVTTLFWHKKLPLFIAIRLLQRENETVSRGWFRDSRAALAYNARRSRSMAAMQDLFFVQGMQRARQLGGPIQASTSSPTRL